MLPAVGLLLLTVREQRDQAIEAATLEARRLASLAVADQGRQIESTRQLLTILARLSEIQRGGDDCDLLMASLLTEFPRYTNLGVINPAGTLTCSGIAPGRPVYLGDLAYFQQAVAEKSFVVGEYLIDRVTRQSALNCGFPVVDAAGNVAAVVYATLDLNSLVQFTAQAKLPNGAVLTVVDRSGNILVRIPESALAVGSSISATKIGRTILSQGTGVLVADDNGQTYLIAFDSLQSADEGTGYLSIALPRAEIVAPAENSFANHLTRLGIAVMIVLIAAWVGTDLLIRQNTDANKVLVRRLYDGFSTGGVDLLDEVVAEEFVDHDPMPDQPQGLVGLKFAVGSFRAAFPDGEMVVEDLVAESDRVVARVSMSGVHRGEYAGAPGSGKMIRAEGVEIYRIADGKIVEGWSRFVLPLTMIESRVDPLMQVAHMPPDLGEESVTNNSGRGRSLIRAFGRIFRRGGD